MPPTALTLSLEELKKYRPLEAIRRRRAKTGADVARRRRLALAVARKAARLLKAEMGANEVILFGSLARRSGFTTVSDIDLAARGIPPRRFFEAVGLVTGLSAEFKIDLVDLETCPPAMAESIQENGKAL